jgi:hypothetical protein
MTHGQENIKFPSGLFLVVNGSTLSNLSRFQISGSLRGYIHKTFSLIDKFNDNCNQGPKKLRASKGKLNSSNFTCEEALTAPFQAVLPHFPTPAAL